MREPEPGGHAREGKEGAGGDGLGEEQDTEHSRGDGTEREEDGHPGGGRVVQRP